MSHIDLSDTDGALTGRTNRLCHVAVVVNVLLSYRGIPKEMLLTFDMLDIVSDHHEKLCGAVLDDMRSLL